MDQIGHQGVKVFAPIDGDIGAARSSEPVGTHTGSLSGLLAGGKTMKIKGSVALITGAASGIGEAAARELANRDIEKVVLVDRSDSAYELAESINEKHGREVALVKIGDTTNDTFRTSVYDEVTANHGVISICVPAAGITRDALAVRLNKETGKAEPYSITTFRQVTEVNLIAPIYWAVEMIFRGLPDQTI